METEAEFAVALLLPRQKNRISGNVLNPGGDLIVLSDVQQLVSRIVQKWDRVGLAKADGGCTAEFEELIRESDDVDRRRRVAWAPVHETTMGCRTWFRIPDPACRGLSRNRPHRFQRPKVARLEVAGSEPCGLERIRPRHR